MAARASLAASAVVRNLRVATSSTNATSATASSTPGADQPIADAQGRALAPVEWLATQLGMTYDATLWHIRQKRIPVVRLGRRILIPTRALEAMAERAISLGADAQLLDPKK